MLVAQQYQQGNNPSQVHTLSVSLLSLTANTHWLPDRQCCGCPEIIRGRGQDCLGNGERQYTHRGSYMNCVCVWRGGGNWTTPVCVCVWEREREREREREWKILCVCVAIYSARCWPFLAKWTSSSYQVNFYHNLVSKNKIISHQFIKTDVSFSFSSATLLTNIHRLLF